MVAKKDLWGLVKYRPQVDPNDLAAAVEQEAAHEPLDYRTRLLIRDSVKALQDYWGPEPFAAWLAASPQRSRIEAISQEGFERPGFPSLAERLMEKTDPEEIKRYLRELGMTLHRPLRLQIGGSAALMLPGYLSRPTDDIDVVDEVPVELRTQYELLGQLKKRYGLELNHFQSHHLPSGWEKRLHSLEPLGKLHVFLVDAYDVVLSKLGSAREKDRDDLRAVLAHLDRETLVRRLRETAAKLLLDTRFGLNAEHNWYILFGEPLPT
jgi:hypothetical protein